MITNEAGRECEDSFYDSADQTITLVGQHADTAADRFARARGYADANSLVVAAVKIDEDCESMASDHGSERFSDCIEDGWSSPKDFLRDDEMDNHRHLMGFKRKLDQLSSAYGRCIDVYEREGKRRWLEAKQMCSDDLAMHEKTSGRISFNELMSYTLPNDSDSESSSD